MKGVLNQKQLKCIELMVHTDMTNLQIAKKIGINNNTITLWLKKDEFQDAMKEEVDKSFKKMATKAQRKLNHLIDSKNDMVSLAACKEVLNKSGYKETEKVESTTTTTIKVDVKDE